ncbi:MAG: GerMN domain-containing protein [Ignavibacteriales bacterium]
MKLKILLASILIMATGCSSIAGLVNDKTKNAQPVIAEAKEKINQDAKKIEPKKDEQVNILLYFGDSESAMLKEEKRKVRLKEVLEDSPKTIINELIKGPATSNLFSAIPAGTKLLSVKKEGDTVIVDFSKEFRDNHNGGSAGEALTIFAVVNSLTEIKDIEKVQFMIEGKIEKEFKGHYEFDKPFEREETIIVK